MNPASKESSVEQANEPSAHPPTCALAGVLAARLRGSREDLTRQWLDRINERVALTPNQIFPSSQLLDHVPLLINGIAAYIESPEAEVPTDSPTVAKAMELGALRHQQGFDAYEILKEYEILGGILFNFFIQAVDTITEPCEKADLMACSARLFRAITIIQQATMTDFLRLAGETISERENKLRAFNQMVSHEIKNRIGAIMGATEILQSTEAASGESGQMMEIVARNAREMAATVESILKMSQLEKDARQHRNVGVEQAVKEAVRQVREAARHANVEIRTRDLPPGIEVDASVVELCISNYLSNSIKYSDPEKPASYAEISATVETNAEGSQELVLRVADNGIGIPAEKRDRLFERFYRAHEDISTIEGTGLGLSIVRTTAESQGGRTWAEFTDKGTVMALALPLRRDEDRKPAAAQGTART